MSIEKTENNTQAHTSLTSVKLYRRREARNGSGTRLENPNQPDLSGHPTVESLCISPCVVS